MKSKIYRWYKHSVFPKIKERRGATRLNIFLREWVEKELSKAPKQQSISDFDWDCLVILDGCRFDTYKDLTGNEGFRWSLGSTTSEFIAGNFAENSFPDTVYVSSNPHFSSELFQDLTGKYPEQVFFEVFHTYDTDWNEEKRTVLPDSVFRDAKTALKLFPDEKLIVHFMQPHYPFVNSDLVYSGQRMVDDSMHKDTVWDKAEKGEVSQQECRKAYSENLEYVLNFVDRLQNVVDGKLVVTADHGNFIGENGIYGHPDGSKSEPVRKVPLDRRDGS